MSFLANISSKDCIRLIPVCNWALVKSLFVISSWSTIDVVDDDSVDWWCIVTGWTSQSTALGGMVIVFVVTLATCTFIIPLWLYWYCISPGSISKSLQFGWSTEECNFNIVKLCEWNSSEVVSRIAFIFSWIIGHNVYLILHYHHFDWTIFVGVMGLTLFHAFSI
jgi:hypothetical protein